MLHAAAIAMFVMFAMQGDSLGIARGMAMLLSVPFAVLTVPAVLLLWSGRRRLAGLVAALAAAVTLMAWAFA